MDVRFGQRYLLRQGWSQGGPVWHRRRSHEAGLAYFKNLTAVAAAYSWSPIPVSWRGTMVPVPRKPGAPLSANNVRGVSAGSHPARVAAIFPAEAGDDHNGSVAMHACRLLLKMPRQGGMSAAALFADVKRGVLPCATGARRWSLYETRDEGGSCGAAEHDSGRWRPPCPWLTGILWPSSGRCSWLTGTYTRASLSRWAVCGFHAASDPTWRSAG